MVPRPSLYRVRNHEFSTTAIDRHGGYKRLGQTAEDAMKVFRMAYEYQENGMMAMTIELTRNNSIQEMMNNLEVIL